MGWIATAPCNCDGGTQPADLAVATGGQSAQLKSPHCNVHSRHFESRPASFGWPTLS